MIQQHIQLAVGQFNNIINYLIGFTATLSSLLVLLTLVYDTLYYHSAKYNETQTINFAYQDNVSEVLTGFSSNNQLFLDQLNQTLSEHVNNFAHFNDTYFHQTEIMFNSLMQQIHNITDYLHAIHQDTQNFKERVIKVIEETPFTANSPEANTVDVLLDVCEYDPLGLGPIECEGSQFFEFKLTELTLTAL